MTTSKFIKMEKRNITITIEKAREWYNSGNEALKEAALQAFEEKELIFNYRDITTFKEDYIQNRHKVNNQR